MARAEALADGLNLEALRAVMPGLRQQRLELIDEFSAVAEAKPFNLAGCVECPAALHARDGTQQIFDVGLILKAICQKLHRNEVARGHNGQSQSAPFFDSR